MSQFNMRCSDGELAKWKSRASQSNLNVSAWLRGLANAEVGLGYRGAVVHQGPKATLSNQQIEEEDDSVRDSHVEYEEGFQPRKRRP